MGMIDDVLALENGELDAAGAARAMQAVINSGDAWRMQGSFGRACMAAIEAGQCMLGVRGNRDYWGNWVPARDQVKAGTKGSRGYVVERMGEEHAAMLEAVA